MEQHFNTPLEVIDTNMKAGEGKAHLPLGKMILLGIMAGAFIALGGATSSTAAHAIDNVGLARFVAGIIFPVGLMIIVFVGGELFTGNCLIVMDVVGKKVTWFECIRNLIVVYFSNLIGALIIDALISGLHRWAFGCLCHQSGSRQGRHFSSEGSHLRHPVQYSGMYCDPDGSGSYGYRR